MHDGDLYGVSLYPQDLNAHRPRIFQETQPPHQEGMEMSTRTRKKERIAIDWDSTLVEEVWPEHGDWLPGAVKALKTLHKHYEIVIFTLRVASVMQDEKTPNPYIEEQAQAIRDKLASIGLHDIEVWQRPYKPPCVKFIDDRGISFKGNWRPIVRELTGRLA
jgi:hypothetical protein